MTVEAANGFGPARFVAPPRGSEPPLDKAGADLLFQIISQRYERSSIILTTNKAYKQWPTIFNNDAGITSAILDRLLHRAHTVVIDGRSYRMKDRLPDDPPLPDLKPAAAVPSTAVHRPRHHVDFLSARE